MSVVVVSSDWHRDRRTAGFDRGPDVEMAVAQVVQVALARKADLFLMLGDLADPDDGPAALLASSFSVRVALQLASRGVAFWAVVGNHDVVEDGSGRSTLSVLEELEAYFPEVRVFSGPEVADVPGKPRVSRGAPFQFLALPFTPLSHSYDPAEYVRSRRSVLGDQVLVGGHLTLDGIAPGEETIEMPRGRDVRFPIEECDPRWVMLNGHYHDGQVYERAGRRVMIPGALARFTHGEQWNRPRFLVLEV